MDLKNFFLGIGFMMTGYLIYRFLLKNERPSSEDSNGKGMTLPNYIGLWGCVIIGWIGGMILILKSILSL